MNIHKEIIKIISFKKNIYLICLILALIYIAFSKLYRKEGLENSCDSIFGKKKDRIIYKDLKTSGKMTFNLETEKKKHVWIDLQSLKINGSKELSIVDTNQYGVDESIFGKKDERIVLKDIESRDAIVIDVNGMKEKKVWVDLQSIKINGSKHLAIVDANQYDVVKKRLSTCEDINVQNNNLKKNLDQYKNRGFFARLFNW
jgi:phage anti-repressor protein